VVHPAAFTCARNVAAATGLLWRRSMSGTIAIDVAIASDKNHNLYSQNQIAVLRCPVYFCADGISEYRGWARPLLTTLCSCKSTATRGEG